MLLLKSKLTSAKIVALLFTAVFILLLIFFFSTFVTKNKLLSFLPHTASLVTSLKTAPESTNSSLIPGQTSIWRCPAGFILVPGSNTYHTNDFCVMKYDAKCADTSNPNQGLQPAHGDRCSGQSGSEFFGTYKNNGQDCACTAQNHKQIVSTKSGFPVAYIPEDSQSTDAVNTAKKYCLAWGWHLLNNNEWMTVARNVEQVPANWCDQDGNNCGFTPGTSGKILANGHNDNVNEASAGASNHGALTAGNDDQPCFGTTSDGSNLCGGASSQKRTLTLSNGEIIWDLAGNVWQWIDAGIMRKNQPKSVTRGVLDRGWIWSEFTVNKGDAEGVVKGGFNPKQMVPAATLATVITNNGSGGELGYDAFRPSNPSWNSSNGVGRIYHYSSANDVNTTVYTYIRGGNWRHGYDSGAFTIHLSPTAEHVDINDVGFRCAVEAEGK